VGNPKQGQSGGDEYVEVLALQIELCTRTTGTGRVGASSPLWAISAISETKSRSPHENIGRKATSRLCGGNIREGPSSVRILQTKQLKDVLCGGATEVERPGMIQHVFTVGVKAPGRKRGSTSQGNLRATGASLCVHCLFHHSLMDSNAVRTSKCRGY